MVQASSLTSADLFLKRWTVDDYHRMISAGILTPDDRVELLDGQIVEMAPQDPPHASRIDDGGDYLKTLFANRAKVRVQLPITLAPGSEPEPDFAIVRIDENRYRDRHPQPQDVLLLIEVADSTMKRDRTHKARIYANAGIGEYWIVDIKRQQLVVLQDLQDGSYQSEQTFTENDQIAPLLLPDVVVNLRHLIL
ncbi:Uma2 family endonuclease [Nodosilinea sp. LEGE 06152]|uniref:Uma2 family endonuclease n=1 Tax=Nodosilinea sp. LEGE 06152 TaxID=2777966 RepID=UPI00187DE679|nr:Uma2 family endonuclease [Nodosilinea sp. LEGE 06152]MBE9160325.1 Uma2 family endonuclease [Nodosilinea sp. LEGE 06152]